MASTNMYFVVAVAVLATGLVAGMNEFCLNMAKCIKPQMASVKNKEVQNLCVETRKQLECLKVSVEKCDEPQIADAYQKTMEKTKETIDRECGASQDGAAQGSGASGTTCMKLSKCIPAALQQGQDNKDVVCREVPKVLQCYKEQKDSCDSEEVKQGTMSSVKILQTHYEKHCNDSGKFSASLSIVLLLACSVLILQGMIRSTA